MGALLCKEDEPVVRDAKILHKALGRCCKDREAVIKVAAHRTESNRLAIRRKFSNRYEKDLIDEFKSKLKGNFRECCVALFLSPAEYDAQWLHKAMTGLRTNDSILIEIMCTRNNQQIREIKECYQSEFHRELKQDLKSKTSGDFKRLLTTLCEADREEGEEVDYDRAIHEAEQLYKAGEKRWGTDENKFIEIIAKSSINQLRATFDEYHKICKYDILQSIDREMSGNLREGLKTIVMSVQNPGEYFAEKLHNCMKGRSTDENTLIRVIVSRLEVDLPQIKSSFKSSYNKPLAMYINVNIGGDFGRLMEQVVARDS